MKKTYRLMNYVALGVVLLDQISKLVVARAIPVFSAVPVIDGFFNLVHVRNRGIAFGLLNRAGSHFGYYLLIGATVVAIALLLLWFARLKEERSKITVGFSLIFGGAVGNLIDRIRLREVIDFLDLYVGSYHWPAFNVADSAITVGTIWIAAVFLFHNPSKKVQ